MGKGEKDLLLAARESQEKLRKMQEKMKKFDGVNKQLQKYELIFAKKTKEVQELEVKLAHQQEDFEEEKKLLQKKL